MLAVVYGTSSWTGSFSRDEVSQKYEGIPSKFVISKISLFGDRHFTRSPEAMANQPNRREHRVQHRPASSKTAGLLSRRFFHFIEIPHGISALFVFSQDLRHELTFGEICARRLKILARQPRPRTAEFRPFAISRWSPSAGGCAETAPARSMKIRIIGKVESEENGLRNAPERLRQRWFSRAHNDDHPPDNRRHELELHRPKRQNNACFGDFQARNAEL